MSQLRLLRDILLGLKQVPDVNPMDLDPKSVNIHTHIYIFKYINQFQETCGRGSGLLEGGFDGDDDDDDDDDNGYDDGDNSGDGGGDGEDDGKTDLIPKNRP